MRYLTIAEIRRLHADTIAKQGGSDGLRDPGALMSAVAQPRMTFGDVDLYPTLIEKAARLGFALIAGHPFVDGNKRTGLLAAIAMLRLNGYVLRAGVEDIERAVVAVASGEDRDGSRFRDWLSEHAYERG